MLRGGTLFVNHLFTQKNLQKCTVLGPTSEFHSLKQKVSLPYLKGTYAWSRLVAGAAMTQGRLNEINVDILEVELGPSVPNHFDKP